MFASSVLPNRSVPEVELLEDRCLPSTAQFVTALYQDVLHRAPSAAEVAGWVNVLNAGANPTAVALAFTTSTEYRTDVVANDYRLYLGRQGSAADIAGWVNRENAGMSEFSVQASFLSSDEFFARAGNATKSWLQAMYQEVLGRPVDGNGIATWTQTLQQGGSRLEVALDIATSPEAFARLVAAAYRDFLGRAPDAAGQAQWASALASGLMPSELAAILVSSEEFIAVQGGLDNNIPGPGFVEPFPVDGFVDPFFFPGFVPIGLGCGCTGIGFTGGFSRGFGGGTGGFTGGFSGGSAT